MAVMDAVGKPLCLQAETGMGEMPLAVDAGLVRMDSGTGIKLQPRLAGDDIELQVALRRDDAGRDQPFGNRCGSLQHEVDVVVVRRRFGAGSGADAAEIAEIER